MVVFTTTLRKTNHIKPPIQGYGLIQEIQYVFNVKKIPLVHLQTHHAALQGTDTTT